MHGLILIIDDDAEIHRLVKTVLSPGLKVLSAYNGKSGLAAANKHAPDLILLDLDMPGLRGDQVCRRLKEDRTTRSIPIVFLSAARSVADRVRGLECGACDFITKPFEPAELRARVQAALRTQKAFSELEGKSMVDGLTGLFDRNYCEMQLDAALAATIRTEKPLGVIVLDIDDMHVVNGAFGRSIGDEMLCAVSKALMQECRRQDVLCRIGADEFAILVPDAQKSALFHYAERARQAVSATVFCDGDREIRVTASGGVAVSTLADKTSIFSQAEGALERAKEAGGNRIILSSSESGALAQISAECAESY